MTIGTPERMLVEQRLANDGPSVAAAYVLWAFLGAFSAHRIYLGRYGTALLQAVLNLVVIGWIWTFIDLFLIPRMVRERQDEARDRFYRGLGG